MSTALPVADGRSVRRYALEIARRHPRMLWSALALHVLAALAALAAPRLLGDLVESVQEGTTVAHVDKIVLAAGRLPAAGDGAHPLRALRLADPRRAGARRAARGLRRQRPGPAGRRRRVRRLGRPADPHVPRRRPARLVGAVGAARVDDRPDHRRAHLRRRPLGRLVGRAAVPARRAAAGVRAAVVPRPRQGRLPARERVLLPHQRDPHRDGRGRPHRRGPRPRGRAGAPAGRRRLEVLRRGALHALPAHRVLPEHGAGLPDPDGADAAASAAGSTPRARCRSARSPRRRSTCRC